LLDFGCVKELPAWVVAAMVRYTRASAVATRTGLRSDWDEYDRAIADAFKLDPGDPGFSIYRQFTLYCLRPYIVDEPFTFSPDYTGGSVDAVFEGMRDLFFSKGKWPRLPSMPQLPADFTFVGRLQWGFYSVLTRLRACTNWHRTLPPENGVRCEVNWSLPNESRDSPAIADGKGCEKRWTCATRKWRWPSAAAAAPCVTSTTRRSPRSARSLYEVCCWRRFPVAR
jgi:hypothetical protein